MMKVMKNRKYHERRGNHRNPETCAATVAVCPSVINRTAMRPKWTAEQPENTGKTTPGSNIALLSPVPPEHSDHAKSLNPHNTARRTT
jgi:hypothetical protein